MSAGVVDKYKTGRRRKRIVAPKTDATLSHLVKSGNPPYPLAGNGRPASALYRVSHKSVCTFINGRSSVISCPIQLKPISVKLVGYSAPTSVLKQYVYHWSNWVKIKGPPPPFRPKNAPHFVETNLA
jgi:hypothetical protein